VFLPFYAFRNVEPPQLFTVLKTVVIECEKLGYHSVWLDDHLMLNSMPILECWTTLSALSAVTQKIRLGTMVTCNSFRNPALLAKIAATVDNLSKGRLELGIGAGVQQNEHIAYGFSFPNPKTRIMRLGEAVEIIKKLWTEDKATYTGKYYEIHEAVCEPKPVQKPHPPITIGGGGENLTLRVTAKHANRYDWGYLPSPEVYKRKLKVLGKHCLSEGRSLDEIEKSCWPAGQIFIGENREQLKQQIRHLIPKNSDLDAFLQTSFVGTARDFIRQLRPYLNLGVSYCMLFFGDLPELSGVRLFAEKVMETLEN